MCALLLAVTREVVLSSTRDSGREENLWRSSVVASALTYLQTVNEEEVLILRLSAVDVTAQHANILKKPCERRAVELERIVSQLVAERRSDNLDM